MQVLTYREQICKDIFYIYKNLHTSTPDGYWFANCVTDQELLIHTKAGYLSTCNDDTDQSTWQKKSCKMHHSMVMCRYQAWIIWMTLLIALGTSSISIYNHYEKVAYEDLWLYTVCKYMRSVHITAISFKMHKAILYGCTNRSSNQ